MAMNEGQDPEKVAAARSLADADPVFGPLNRLLSLLREEDERGLVLLSAAFAEDSLGRLIGAFLLENKSAGLLLAGFNAPLGTFASRTKAAHALGLISDVQFADLEKLRSIRNDFAHTWDQTSLSTQSIADRIRAMTPSRIPSSNLAPTSLRHALTENVACILTEIEVAITNGRRLKASAMHLSLTPPPR